MGQNLHHTTEKHVAHAFSTIWGHFPKLNFSPKKGPKTALLPKATLTPKKINFLNMGRNGPKPSPRYSKTPQGFIFAHLAPFLKTHFSGGGTRPTDNPPPPQAEITFHALQ